MIENTFTENELKAIQQFKEEHSKCYLKKDAEIPRFSFTITQEAGTGIGINTFIECNSCRKRKDITDYDVW